MAFGAGSEVGHRAIGAMFGGSSAPRHEQAPAPAAAAAPAQVTSLCNACMSACLIAGLFAC